MKDLSTYIFERINPIPKHEKGIVVFDIDDTLLKVNPDVLKVYKKDPNTGKETTLTTAEFAIDPDAKDHKDWFDYRDFQDPKKVYDSILSATPLIKNLKIMDAYIKAGYDFCFLTARACEDVVTDALKKFLMYRDDLYGIKFKKKIPAISSLKDKQNANIILTSFYVVDDSDRFGLYIASSDGKLTYYSCWNNILANDYNKR